MFICKWRGRIHHIIFRKRLLNQKFLSWKFQNKWSNSIIILFLENEKALSDIQKNNIKARKSKKEYSNEGPIYTHFNQGEYNKQYKKNQLSFDRVNIPRNNKSNDANKIISELSNEEYELNHTLQQNPSFK